MLALNPDASEKSVSQSYRGGIEIRENTESARGIYSPNRTVVELKYLGESTYQGVGFLPIVPWWN